MNTQKHSEEIRSNPIEKVQAQALQISKLINDELSKLYLNDGDSDRKYGKILTAVHDHIMVKKPNVVLEPIDIQRNINTYFTTIPNRIEETGKLFSLSSIESNILINHLKHFVLNLSKKREVLKKEIESTKENLALERLKLHKPEIYEGLMNNQENLTLWQTGAYLSKIEEKNIPFAEYYATKEVNEGIYHINLYQVIATEIIEYLKIVNPLDEPFNEGFDNMYKAYINSNSILENDYPSKDKAFFERQWLEHDSIIDKAGEKLYLGKLKKHWMNHLNERKDLVRKQELMDIPQDKKIVAKEHLFAMNYDEYDLTLAEYAENIKKNITANKEYYKEETEDYVSQGHPLQYDEKGKIKALNPTTKNDIIKNYYGLRAAEFFLNNH